MDYPTLIAPATVTNQEINKRKTYMIDANNLSPNLKVLEDLSNSATCLSLSMNPDGKAYAVALADGVINVYLTRTDRLVYTVNPNSSKSEKAHDYSATCVRFRPWGMGDVDPNNLILATFTNGAVKTFHYPTGECVHETNEHREVITCDYSQIGDTFATTGNDGKLQIYDDETREKLITYDPPFYENSAFRRTYAIAYNPQSTNELITGGWDNVVRYYDLRTPTMIKQFYGPNICGEGLAFDPSGQEICTASWRRRDALQLWDYSSGQLIKTISLSTLPSVKFGSDDEGSARSLSYGKIRKNSQARSSISLPMINGIKSVSVAQVNRRSRPRQSVVHFSGQFLSTQDEDERLTVPQLLYSCRYFRNCNLIVFGGSHENGVGIINKHTDEVLCQISGLKQSVYCVSTHRSKIVLTSGNFVALVDTGL